MTNKPIEITEKDLVDRPPGLKPGDLPTKPGDMLSQVKSGIKQAKEIMDLGKELGFDLGKLGLGQGSKPGARENLPATNNAQQFQNFIRLLIFRYGDITVNECLDKLKEDLGNKKLSQLIGGL